MSYIKHTEKALNILRGLPRVSIANIRDNPGANRGAQRGRAQHGGDKHGAGNKGSGQRQNFMRLGYETGNFPFYRRFPQEHYYKNHHLRREYIPITMDQLQMMIDTDRLDTTKPIDLIQISNTGLFNLQPHNRQYGFALKDDGIECFKAKVNIEVQHASELVISHIEKIGGVIRTAYFDMTSLVAMKNPKLFFERSVPIPRRMIPPQDAIEYYTDPKTRGYLADPEAISNERLVLAQKYGYQLPKIEDDPQYEMFCQVKDPRQIFFGLEPGWVVNLPDHSIIKPLATYENQHRTDTKAEASA